MQLGNANKKEREKGAGRNRALILKDFDVDTQILNFSILV